MLTEVRYIHERTYRAALGIVDLESVGYILMHVTIEVTGNTAHAREERTQEAIYGRIND